LPTGFTQNGKGQYAANIFGGSVNMAVQPVDLMLVAPHPDDPEMGMGGTVARYTASGKRVLYVICTNGDKGSSDPDMTPERLIKIREKEQRQAAETLGVGDILFLGYPDQGLEDSFEFRQRLVRLIRQYRPEIVATTDPYRRYVWHRDHRICGVVTLDAIFPGARDRLAYTDLLAEGIMPHKVKEIWCWGTEDPNYVVDISATFHQKMAAVACHRSQFGNVSPAMVERMTRRAREMAAGQPFAMAENFHRVEAPP
jgi:LmbE family N-acetylglucosaminyl deacetylase